VAGAEVPLGTGNGAIAEAVSLTNGSNFYTLKSLVARHAPDFPAAIDEWQAYLDSLQPYASMDGRLPPELDDLVAEVFSPLV